MAHTAFTLNYIACPLLPDPKAQHSSVYDTKPSFNPSAATFFPVATHAAPNVQTAPNVQPPPNVQTPVNIQTPPKVRAPTNVQTPTFNAQTRSINDAQALPEAVLGSDILRSEIVALCVLSPLGPSYKFNIHSGLLEAKCQTIYLSYTQLKEKGMYPVVRYFEDADAGTLVRFISWAYTGNYEDEHELGTSEARFVPGVKCEQNLMQFDKRLYDEYYRLAIHSRLYIFADAYSIKDLKTLACKRLKSKLREMGKLYRRKDLVIVNDLLDSTFTKLRADDPLLDFLGKYAAHNIVNLGQQELFRNTILGKMGPAICKYLQPCTEDPLVDPDAHTIGI